MLICNVHWFPNDPPVGGQECMRCGIIYCPVAYDHEDGEVCACCGFEG